MRIPLYYSAGLLTLHLQQWARFVAKHRSPGRRLADKAGGPSVAPTAISLVTPQLAPHPPTRELPAQTAHFKKQPLPAAARHLREDCVPSHAGGDPRKVVTGLRKRLQWRPDPVPARPRGLNGPPRRGPLSPTTCSTSPPAVTELHPQILTAGCQHRASAPSFSFCPTGRLRRNGPRCRPGTGGRQAMPQSPRPRPRPAGPFSFLFFLFKEIGRSSA